MNSNDKFSFRRFWEVTKRDAAMNWRQTAAFMLEITGLLIIGLLIIYLQTVHFIPIADTFQLWFSTVATIGAYVLASRIFKPLQSKSGSIDMLMLPASNAEKFLARVFNATVTYVVLTFVVLVAVSILNYLLAFLFGTDDYSSLTWYALKNVLNNDITSHVATNNTDISAGVLLFIGTAWTVWIHSSFALGSALWRKFPFVKTMFVGIVVTVVLLIVIAKTCASFAGNEVEAVKSIFYSIGAVEAALAVSNWWLAYWLFKRKQVVEIKR